MVEHMKDYWLYMTPQLRIGIDTINIVDIKKFQLLLNRILLEIKQNSNAIISFTDEEKQKLLTNFSVKAEELEYMINSSAIIICQAVYNITNPDKFKGILTGELRMHEDKAQVFANIWYSNAKSLILKMKQKTVYSTQLDDISWLVNIEIASDNNAQTFVPKSILQLKLKEEEGYSNLHLEFEEQELFELFNTLENIQGALDSLG